MALIDAVREALQNEQPFIAREGWYRPLATVAVEIIYTRRQGSTPGRRQGSMPGWLHVRIIPYNFMEGYRTEEQFAAQRQIMVDIRDDVTQTQEVRNAAQQRIDRLDEPRRRREELEGAILRLLIEGAEEQSQPLVYHNGRWQAIFQEVPANANCRLAI